LQELFFGLMFTNEKEARMKIALPSRDGMIDGHFGHCEYFTVVTIEDDKIIEEDRLDPPEGCGCKSNIVPVMAQMGISVMLAGNMGQGAVNILGAHGIQVIRGCSGTPKNAVEQWIAGQVQDTGQACEDHGSCHD
jgi:predicted Fe-Mo cluster-binding NifX family protein